MNDLLSRYAECVFWKGRYVERAENVARILDVHETFTRDRTGSVNWSSVVTIHADDERFYATHPQASAKAVVDFYLLDPENPTSIFSSIRAARDNARTLRPLISTEMWTHINVFYNTMKSMTPADVSMTGLSQTCSIIKENCQTHFGITEGTFYRDASWYFYLMGKYLERADQTSRILDIKYNILTPREPADASAIDASQWNALLRSVAGYHAFRRTHPRGLSPAAVAQFLLFDSSFPRSVTMCFRQVDDMVHRLRARFGLRNGAVALERLDEVRAAMDQHTIDDVLREGLHEFSDWIQRQALDLTADIQRDFFG
ncbi:MAG: alpha-E domain-containing protein [Alphaproteobacteria bacterium]|nr:alpha-E domain-containing protein [Alphaproteobacteria bacterium]